MAKQKSLIPREYGQTVRKKDVVVLSSRLVFEGPAFRVHTDLVREGKRTGRRDIVKHNGSVVILAVDDSVNKRDPHVLLIEQYRHAAGQELWELPAGRVDAGEKRLAAAKRELTEETGIRAKSWKRAFVFWASPGFVGESMDIFLARGLRMGAASPEEDEQIHVRFTPLSQAVKMVMSNKIQDAKTMVGLLWLARKLDAKRTNIVVRRK